MTPRPSALIFLLTLLCTLACSGLVEPDHRSAFVKELDARLSVGCTNGVLDRSAEAQRAAFSEAIFWAIQPDQDEQYEADPRNERLLDGVLSKHSVILGECSRRRDCQHQLEMKSVDGRTPQQFKEWLATQFDASLLGDGFCTYWQLPVGACIDGGSCGHHNHGKLLFPR